MVDWLLLLLLLLLFISFSLFFYFEILIFFPSVDFELLNNNKRVTTAPELLTFIVLIVFS